MGLRLVRCYYIKERLRCVAHQILASFASTQKMIDPKANVRVPSEDSMPFQVGSSVQDLPFFKNHLLPLVTIGIPTPVEGVETRWLSELWGALCFLHLILVYSASIVLTIGEGMPERKIQLAKSLLSGQGWNDEESFYVRFEPRVRQKLISMTRPSFLVSVATQKLLLRLGFGPLDDTSSRLDGLSLRYLGGTGSTIRGVIRFLREVLFVGNVQNRMLRIAFTGVDPGHN